MKRVIIGDSCLELNESLIDRLDIKLVPLHLNIGEDHFLDDGELDMRDFVDKMHAYDGVAMTAAPSPQMFFDAALGYDEAFIITLTSELSTTYNSAMLAKQMLIETYPDMKVHVFDSKSAASGESLVALHIQTLMDQGRSFEEIVENTEAMIKNMRTYFVLENLENLVKNGRMSKIAGKVAKALSVNPVCKGNDGVIEVVSKTRGMRAGINKLVSEVTDGLTNLNEKTLMITHVLNPERALEVKKKFLEKHLFKEVLILPAKGVSSVYANEGGIIVAL